MDGVPQRYQETGQPVIIGGSMETGSYLLTSTPEGNQTFFSTAHGSGRTMSRTKARKFGVGVRYNMNCRNVASASARRHGQD
jgi:tRNA-splicing ligase RtcB